MLIQFERTGGFTGLRMKASIDTQSLDPAEAEILANLVRLSDFFNMPGTFITSNERVDQFHYRLTIDKEGHTHTFYADESALPDQIRPLIDHLAAFIRQSRRPI
jgi:hypothetical protein